MRLPTLAARQLPDQSTTLRVDSSSTDDLRLRGALPTVDISCFARPGAALPDRAKTARRSECLPRFASSASRFDPRRRQWELCCAWANQIEITVEGPDELGHALADLVRRIRSQ